MLVQCSQRACGYSVDCVSGPGPEVGRGDGLRWVEPYLAVYSACVAASAHPGVDISIMEYLGKSNELQQLLFYSLFIAVEPVGFGTSVLVESGFGIIFPVPKLVINFYIYVLHKIVKFLIDYFKKRKLKKEVLLQPFTLMYRYTFTVHLFSLGLVFATK